MFKSFAPETTQSDNTILVRRFPNLILVLLLIFDTHRLPSIDTAIVPNPSITRLPFISHGLKTVSIAHI